MRSSSRSRADRKARFERVQLRCSQVVEAVLIFVKREDLARDLRGVGRRGRPIQSVQRSSSVDAHEAAEATDSVTPSEPQAVSNEPQEEPPDVTLMVRLLGRAISRRFQTLLNLDRADFDERANDAAPRSQRDQLADDVHGLLVDYRQVSDLAFGEELSQTLVPITGPTASVPSEVYRQDGTSIRLRSRLRASRQSSSGS